MSAAPEHPAVRVRRLSKELSLALAEDTDGIVSLALIYPAGAHDYPIHLCHDRQFAKMTKALFAYREAHQEKVRIYAETFKPNESVPLPARPEHSRYWDAFHRSNLAHYALVDTFELDFDGEVAA